MGRIRSGPNWDQAGSREDGLAFEGRTTYQVEPLLRTLRTVTRFTPS